MLLLSSPQRWGLQSKEIRDAVKVVPALKPGSIWHQGASLNCTHTRPCVSVPTPHHHHPKASYTEKFDLGHAQVRGTGVAKNWAPNLHFCFIHLFSWNPFTRTTQKPHTDISLWPPVSSTEPFCSGVIKEKNAVIDEGDGAGTLESPCLVAPMERQSCPLQSVSTISLPPPPGEPLHILHGPVQILTCIMPSPTHRVR